MTQPIQPLNLIRRSVHQSAAQLKTLFQTESPPRRRRTFTYESLEDRRVLTATGFEPIVDPGPPVAALVSVDNFLAETDAAQQATEIQSLTVSVNGIEQVLDAQHAILQLQAGDTLKIANVGFYSNATDGVFAAESYINKISDATSRSQIDYNDGRFSDRDSNPNANGGQNAIGELAGAWTVADGWDRLTINLMHYTETSTAVTGRFFVNMQVGQPDFAFDTDALNQVLDQDIRVGHEVNIPAGWFNGLKGTFQNYAEVDIYHSSDPDTIVWAGAIVGNASPDSMVAGEFLNTRSDDPFSEKWTPDQSGEYILKYTLDPEFFVNESNEANNEYEIRLVVQDINVAEPFQVEPVSTGLEDTPIELKIETEFDSVLISDVPKDAELSVGQKVGKDTYEVQQDDLAGLTITPPPQSDGDFTLTVTPMSEEGSMKTLSQTIEVVVLPVIDGGEVIVDDLSIWTGKKTNLKVSNFFTDLDGSESHQISVSGIPDFMELSNGEKVESSWLLSTADLTNLKIAADSVKDLSDWESYGSKYAYKAFDVKFEIRSTEADSDELQIFSETFALYAWQRQK